MSKKFYRLLKRVWLVAVKLFEKMLKKCVDFGEKKWHKKMLSFDLTFSLNGGIISSFG
jgi:hypothetical protein